MSFVRVASPQQLQSHDQRLHTTVDGRYITVINRRGKLYCIDSTCYHAGGPLGLGDVQEVQGEQCIVCPWHMYQISLNTGAKLYQALEMGPDKKLVPSGWKHKELSQRVHRVERRQDGVYVKLDLSGKWDSDEYGTSTLCGERCAKGDKNKAHAGKDGSVTGGFGANKVQYRPQGGGSGGLPFRSGHVLNPPKSKANPSKGASDASPMQAPVRWFPFVVAAREKESNCSIRLQLVTTPPDGVKLKNHVPEPSEIMARLSELGISNQFANLSSSGHARNLSTVLNTFHVNVRALIGDELVERPYTFTESRFVLLRRVQSQDKKQRRFVFELCVKVYAKGAMSHFMSKLKPGASLELSLGRDAYLTRKMEKLDGAKIHTSHVAQLVLFAGGSGITPMLQILQNALCMSPLSITLIYANRNQKSIMMAPELIDLVKTNPNRISLHFMLSEKPSKPKALTVGAAAHCVHGKLDDSYVRKVVLDPTQLDKKVGVFAWSGPEGFNATVRDALLSMGYTDRNSVSCGYQG